MQARLIYFSQTGATRKVAHAIGAGLEKLGAAVDLVPFKKTGPDRLGGVDLIGVGAPCFSSRAPEPVLEFIAAGPRLAGQKAFGFATSGGGPGRVLTDLGSALRAQGADVIAGLLLRGECFHPFPSIKGRFPGRPDGVDLEEAAGFGRALYRHLEAGRPGPLPHTRADALRPGRGFYHLIGSTFTDDQIRRGVPAPQVAPHACDQCGLCQKECPSGALRLDPYPTIDSRCLRCFRCYNICPRQALTAKLLGGDLLSRIFYNVWFERWLGDVKAGERPYGERPA